MNRKVDRKRSRDFLDNLKAVSMLLLFALAIVVVSLYMGALLVGANFRAEDIEGKSFGEIVLLCLAVGGGFFVIGMTAMGVANSDTLQSLLRKLGYSVLWLIGVFFGLGILVLLGMPREGIPYAIGLVIALTTFLVVRARR